MIIPKAPTLDQWAAARMADAMRGGIDTVSRDAFYRRALQETLDGARQNSPFYRERFAGRPPIRFRSLRDVEALPFTTDADLRNDPLSFLGVSQDQVARVFTLATSGTTSAPKRVFFTERDLAATADFFTAGMSAMTGEGARVLILLPGGAPESVGDLLTRAIARLGAHGVVQGAVTDLAQTATAIRETGTDCIVGMPVQVLAVAHHPVAAGIARGRIRSVLLTGDHVPRAATAALSNAWGCRVFEHYGMTEMGFGGAVSCDALEGLHLREADLFFEIIDPVTGNPVRGSEPGEVVFTTLGREAMPLIRYRTGDMAAWMAGPCPCGCHLRRILPVRGRIGDVLRLGGGAVLSPADLDEALFAVDGVLDYTAELQEAHGRLRLSVQISTAGTGDRGTTAAADRALGDVPALRAAGADGRLETRVTSSPGQGLFTTGWRKRTIADRRVLQPG